MIKNLFKQFLFLIPIVFITLAMIWLFPLDVVPTNSMYPEIPEHSFVISTQLYNNVDRGNIVIFKYQNTFLVKRVIAKGGDRVNIKNEKVYVNGHPSFYGEVGKTYSEKKEFIVPANEYFMMGDNREKSYDSRKWSYSYIKKETIIAKVHIIIGIHNKKTVLLL